MPKKQKTKYKFVALLIIVVIVTVVILFVFVGKKPAESTSSETPHSTEKVEENKEEIPTEPVKKEEDIKTPIQNEGEDPNTKEMLTGYINYSNVNENNLLIRTTIDQYLTTGSCELTLTSSTGQKYNYHSKIESFASTSSCDGFEIPISELEPGQYFINIIISSGNKEGTITGKANV